MSKERVLFICVHNSARSQMAEAFLKQYGGERFETESAGIEPGVLNPFVVKAMLEIGIDISQHCTRSAWDLLQQGKTYDTVITVCDESNGERCPVFPGTHERLHWDFDDPSGFIGTDDDKMLRTRILRDAIKLKIQELLRSRKGIMP